ncbi:MAG: hypothetical protein RL367_313 [Pseudomonadota bacterium]|jgi:hypothetical protein
MPAPRLKQSPDIIDAEVDGNPLLLDLRDFTHSALNPVARQIWALFAEPRNRDAVIAALAGDYEGDAAAIAADIDDFIAALVGQSFLVSA